MVKGNLKVGTKVRISDDLDFEGRIGDIRLSEPFRKFSPYSGQEFFTYMVGLYDKGPHQGRSMEMNSERLTVIENDLWPRWPEGSE